MSQMRSTARRAFCWCVLLYILLVCAYTFQIGNLSRHVEPTVSSSALTDILTASKLRELLGSSTQLPVKRALPTDEQEDSPIRRMFVKHVPTAGIMLLLFHDIRYALAAKILFSTRFTDALDFCINTPDPSAYLPWLTCRFLSKRELCTVCHLTYSPRDVAHLA